MIGFAATTDVGAPLATAASCAPFALLAYRSAYSAAIDASEVLASRLAPTPGRDAGSFCVDRAQQVYPDDDGAATYSTEFHQTLQVGAPEMAAPAFAQALADNATGLTGHGFPALLIQGGQDVAVSALAQERFANRRAHPPLALLAALTAALRPLPQRHRR